MIIDELGVDKLICPICGNPKYLRTICSGNTFGGRIWSDSRHEYPMMLSHSTIQICNHCGHYFHIDNAKCEYVSEREVMCSLEKEARDAADAGHPFDKQKGIDLYLKRLSEFKQGLQDAIVNRFGRLSLSQLYDAYGDIVTDNAPAEQIQDYLLMYIWAYNEPHAVHDERTDAHACKCAMKLISILGESNPLTAELYRELGQFEKAIEICQSLLTKSFEPDVVREIMDRAIRHDTAVFVVVES